MFHDSNCLQPLLGPTVASMTLELKLDLPGQLQQDPQDPEVESQTETAMDGKDQSILVSKKIFSW